MKFRRAVAPSDDKIGKFDCGVIVGGERIARQSWFELEGKRIHPELQPVVKVKLTWKLDVPAAQGVNAAQQLSSRQSISTRAASE
ncbi:MAG: hypothetical protein KGL61_13420 [Burkholderiales bacterium]|nr:hypothetical protein [Burkholderiales bacterium]